MLPTIPTAGGDLASILQVLDAADTAVRDVYRKLADDPDLASEHETVLRELHSRRIELSRQAGHGRACPVAGVALGRRDDDGGRLDNGHGGTTNAGTGGRL